MDSGDYLPYDHSDSSFSIGYLCRDWQQYAEEEEENSYRTHIPPQSSVSCPFSTCLFVYITVCYFASLSVNMYVHLPVYLFINKSLCLPSCLFVSLSINLSACFSVCLSICLSLCQSFCLPTYLSICMSSMYMNIHTFTYVHFNICFLCLMCAHIRKHKHTVGHIYLCLHLYQSTYISVCQSV